MVMYLEVDILFYPLCWPLSYSFNVEINVLQFWNIILSYFIEDLPPQFLYLPL